MTYQRPDECSWDVPVCISNFLSHVHTTIRTRDRESRQQQTDTEADAIVAPAAGILESGPHKLAACFRAQSQEHDDNDEKEQHMAYSGYGLQSRKYLLAVCVD